MLPIVQKKVTVILIISREITQEMQKWPKIKKECATLADRLDISRQTAQIKPEKKDKNRNRRKNAKHAEL